MGLEEARAYDRRKEEGPARYQVAVKSEMIWRMIEPHLPRDKNRIVLDLGGGTGVWGLRIAELGYRVVIVDVSAGFLARAREKAIAAGVASRVTFMENDICDLSVFEGETSDLVLALGDPICCGSSPDRTAKGIFRVTRNGGWFIGDVENRYRSTDERRACGWQELERVLLDGGRTGRGRTKPPSGYFSRARCGKCWRPRAGGHRDCTVAICW
jgi:ubiquinone/menaquinone biosynthesis C-methylase UbiE